MELRLTLKKPLHGLRNPLTKAGPIQQPASAAGRLVFFFFYQSAQFTDGQGTSMEKGWSKTLPKHSSIFKSQRRKRAMSGFTTSASATTM
jgi:hypothetical protein